MAPASSRLMLVATILTSLTGCASWLPAHPKSDQTKDEVVEIFADEEKIKDTAATAVKQSRTMQVPGTTESKSDMTPQFAVPAAALAALASQIPAGVDAAFDAYQADLKRELESHVATYSATYAGEFFTEPPRKDSTTGVFSAKVNPKSFMLVREANGKPQSLLSFDVETSSHGDGFAIVFKELWMRGSKAKVLHASWWTKIPLLYGWLVGSEPEVNVSVSLTVTSMRVDGTKGEEIRLVRTMPLPVVGGVALDGKDSPPEQSKNSPPEQSKAAAAVASSDLAAIKSRVLAAADGWTKVTFKHTPEWQGAVLPSTYAGGAPWGTGLYTLKIEVTETDKLGAKLLKEAQDYFDAHRKEWEQKVVQLASSQFDVDKKATEKDVK